MVAGAGETVELVSVTAPSVVVAMIAVVGAGPLELVPVVELSIVFVVVVAAVEPVVAPSAVRFLVLFMLASRLAFTVVFMVLFTVLAVHWQVQVVFKSVFPVVISSVFAVVLLMTPTKTFAGSGPQPLADPSARGRSVRSPPIKRGPGPGGLDARRPPLRPPGPTMSRDMKFSGTRNFTIAKGLIGFHVRATLRSPHVAARRRARARLKGEGGDGRGNRGRHWIREETSVRTSRWNAEETLNSERSTTPLKKTAPLAVCTIVGVDGSPTRAFAWSAGRAWDRDERCHAQLRWMRQALRIRMSRPRPHLESDQTRPSAGVCSRRSQTKQR